MSEIYRQRIGNLGLTIGLAAVLLLIVGLMIASPGSGASPASAQAQQSTCTTIVVGGLVTTHTTWAIAGSPYCIQDAIYIDPGITLTIEPGVTVYFSETLAGVPTSLDVDGSLVAAGTPTQPITFTSVKATPHPGDWSYINIRSGAHAHLAYCDISYAGAPAMQRAAVEIHSSDVLIDHCTIHDTGNNLAAIGILDTGLSPTIRDTVIRNNSSYAIHQETANMSPVYRNLTLTGNVTDAVYIAMSMITRPVTLDGKELGGKPFILVGVSVDSSGVLTLSPGTEVWLMGHIGVNEDGVLSAVGTAAQPITITSAHPSVFAGGLSFERNSTAHLAYCDISRGGNGPWAAVDIRSSDVVIENCRIHDNNADGIYIGGEWGTFTPRPTLRGNRIYNHSGIGLQVYSAQPILQGNAFYDNAEYALYHISVALPSVDARHQWWGHAGGPYHPTLNPGGLGNQVSDGVLFDPWLTTSDNRPPAVQMVWPPAGTVFSDLPITFTMVADDPDDWQPLYFRVEVLSGTAVIATFDQTGDASGWDRPSYVSGVTATLTLSRALANGAYTWRAAVFDGFGFVPAGEERSFQVNVSGMKVSAVEPAEIIATPNQTLTLQVYGIGFTNTAQVWLEQDHGGGNIERLDPVQMQVVSAGQITLGVNFTGRSGPWDVVVSQDGATRRARLYVFPYMPLMAVEYRNPGVARLGGTTVHQLQLTNRGTAPGVGIVGLVVPTGTEVLTDCFNAVEYLGQPTAGLHLLAITVQRGKTERVPVCLHIPWDQFNLGDPLRIRFWVLAQPTPEAWQALKQGASGNLEQLIGGAIEESALTEGRANDRYVGLANGNMAQEYIERLGARYPYVADALVSRQLLDFQLAMMAALGRKVPEDRAAQVYSSGSGMPVAPQGFWGELADGFIRDPWETTKAFLTGCYEGWQSGQAGAILLAEMEGFIGSATFGLWRPDLGAATAAHVTGLDPSMVGVGRTIGEILNYGKTAFTVGSIAKWGYGTLVKRAARAPLAVSGVSYSAVGVGTQSVLHPSISVLWGENYLVQWGNTAGVGPHWGIAWTSEAITTSEPITPIIQIFVVDGHIYKHSDSVPYDWPRWSDFGSKVHSAGEVPADEWLRGDGTGGPTLPPGPPQDSSACNPGAATVGGSLDPNDIEGMPRLSHIRVTQPLEFLIRFENVPTATLPAETVTVTLPIHPNLDWDSLRVLGVSHPVSLSVDAAARTIIWQFNNINLPPNQHPPEGEGWIRLKVDPLPTLTTGQQVTAQATIRFDNNPPLDTNVLTYTIDMLGPTSVLSVGQVEGPVASLWVTATDNVGGIGVSSVAVYYSRDGAQWTLGGVLTGTVPSQVLSGVVAFTAPGGTYTLQASAVDRLGNFGSRSGSVQVSLPYRLYLPVVLKR